MRIQKLWNKATTWFYYNAECRDEKLAPDSFLSIRKQQHTYIHTLLYYTSRPKSCMHSLCKGLKYEYNLTCMHTRAHTHTHTHIHIHTYLFRSFLTLIRRPISFFISDRLLGTWARKLRAWNKRNTNEDTFRT